MEKKLGMWVYQIPESFHKDIQELLKVKDPEGVYMTMKNRIAVTGKKRANMKSALWKAIEYYS